MSDSEVYYCENAAAKLKRSPFCTDLILLDNNDDSENDCEELLYTPHMLVTHNSGCMLMIDYYDMMTTPTPKNAGKISWGIVRQHSHGLVTTGEPHIHTHSTQLRANNSQETTVTTHSSSSSLPLPLHSPLSRD